MMIGKVSPSRCIFARIAAAGECENPIQQEGLWRIPSKQEMLIEGVR
jgi:hypothetical protein